MRDVLLACGASARLHIDKYPAWGVLLNDDDPVIASPVLRSRPFLDNLFSDTGSADVQRLLDDVLPLGDVATSISPAWIRLGDVKGSLQVAVPRAASVALPKLWRAGLRTARLLDPFERLLRKHVKDGFAYDFINLVCFLLAGVEADRIPTAEVAYLLREWAPPKGASNSNSTNGIGSDNITSGSTDDCVLEHISGGGVSALAAALAHTITDNDETRSIGGGDYTGMKTTRPKSVVRTNARVASVLVDDTTGAAIGVELSNGERVHGTHVISNASAWDVSSLLPEPWKSTVDQQVNSTMERCASFMHINIALPVSALPSGLAAKLLPNYVVVRDFSKPLDMPGNVTLVSVPSVLDSSVCPEGYVVAHAYLPATEPYDVWHALDAGSNQYKELKRKRAKPLWQALRRVFEMDTEEDVERLAEIVMVGTPKTHSRFLNRRYGSYGPRVDARRKGLGIGVPFPGEVRVPRMMHCVGDGVFPGIGVPAVAASAWLVVNGMLSVAEQERLLKRVEANGK